MITTAEMLTTTAPKPLGIEYNYSRNLLFLDGADGQTVEISNAVSELPIDLRPYSVQTNITYRNNDLDPLTRQQRKQAYQTLRTTSPMPKYINCEFIESRAHSRNLIYPVGNGEQITISGMLLSHVGDTIRIERPEFSGMIRPLQLGTMGTIGVTYVDNALGELVTVKAKGILGCYEAGEAAEKTRNTIRAQAKLKHLPVTIPQILAQGNFHGRAAEWLISKSPQSISVGALYNAEQTILETQPEFLEANEFLTEVMYQHGLLQHLEHEAGVVHIGLHAGNWGINLRQDRGLITHKDWQKPCFLEDLAETVTPQQINNIKGIAFINSVMHLWQDFWDFRTKTPAGDEQYMRYVINSLTGFLGITNVEQRQVTNALLSERYQQKLIDHIDYGLIASYELLREMLKIKYNQDILGAYEQFCHSSPIEKSKKSLDISI